MFQTTTSTSNPKQPPKEVAKAHAKRRLMEDHLGEDEETLCCMTHSWQRNTISPPFQPQYSWVTSWYSSSAIPRGWCSTFTSCSPSGRRWSVRPSVSTRSPCGPRSSHFALINRITLLASRFIKSWIQDKYCLLLQVFTAFSHLFLVLNSSINILIYSLLSSRFRDEVVKRMRRIRCCNKSSMWTPDVLEEDNRCSTGTIKES